VGSGYSLGAIDRTVQRMGGTGGKPFVPGSEIKGVLRHQCERLAAACGLRTVDPHAVSQSQQEKIVRHFVPLAESPLVVDRLFGSRFQGECLFIDHALPAEDSEILTGSITRTAIDRVTGTVKKGHLFCTEQVSGAGVRMSSELNAFHPAGVLTQESETAFPLEYALLVAGLLSIESFGGDKSCGTGRCRIEIREILWNDESLSVDEALKSFAEQGSDWSAWLEMCREGTG